MDKKVSTLVFLLVLTLSETAHALIRASPKDKETTTIPVKQGSTNQNKNFNIVKQNVARSKSVVQDWSLVCEQLCGAALGGPPCGPQCDKIEENQRIDQTNLTKSLIGSHEKEICSNLCRNKLGGSFCNCTNTKMARTPIRLDRNTICNSFCENSQITLAGCSPCQIDGAENGINETTQLHEQNNYVSSTISTTTPSTTPNWDHICLSLCKIGEGGALCNCDLPPFL